MDLSQPSFFFGGNSWGCIYLIGVYAGLKQRMSPDELLRMRWGGVSSGALISLGAALDKSVRLPSIIPARAARSTRGADCRPC